MVGCPKKKKKKKQRQDFRNEREIIIFPGCILDKKPQNQPNPKIVPKKQQNQPNLNPRKSRNQ